MTTILTLGETPEEAIKILMDAYVEEGISARVLRFDTETQIRNRFSDRFLPRFIQAMLEMGVNPGLWPKHFEEEKDFELVQSVVDRLSDILVRDLFFDRLKIESVQAVVFPLCESYDQEYLDFDTSFRVDSEYAPPEMDGWEYLTERLKPKDFYSVRKDETGQYWLYGTGELGSALPRL